MYSDLPRTWPPLVLNLRNYSLRKVCLFCSLFTATIFKALLTSASWDLSYPPAPSFLSFLDHSWIFPVHTIILMILQSLTKKDWLTDFVTYVCLYVCMYLYMYLYMSLLFICLFYLVFQSDSWRETCCINSQLQKTWMEGLFTNIWAGLKEGIKR